MLLGVGNTRINNVSVHGTQANSCYLTHISPLLSVPQ